MTSWVVCDSGILLATVLPETYSQHAVALLRYWDEQDFRLAAPVLFRYELLSVMRKSVYRNILTSDEAIRKRDILLAQPVQLMVNDKLLRRGYELASKHNFPAAYDSQYLAVAEFLSCEFWTADQRLYNALQQQLSWVKWLGQFTK